jgi:pyruvate-ferredoxin/flavodoxin oxidoreductase
MVFDTEVYSNTGGQASKASSIGQVAQFAAAGKAIGKKNLAEIAMSYGYVYVAQIAMGADMNQTLKAIKEAEAYNGPSLIIAYCPCIAQGIIKGMKNAINEEREATNSGYFPLFHYNPASGKFSLDSKADFSKYKDFLVGENRYLSLTKITKDSEKLFNENKETAIKDYSHYEALSKIEEDE